MCEGATDGGNDAAETGADGDRSSVEERYRTVFEHNNDAVLIVDLEEEAFIDVNPKACELRKFEEKASRFGAGRMSIRRRRPLQKRFEPRP